MIIKQYQGETFKVNNYLIYDETFKEREALLIDVSNGAINEILDFVLEKGLIIEKVLLTHAHYDHIEGLLDLLRIFPNVDIYLHDSELAGLFSSKDNLSYLMSTPFDYKDVKFNYKFLNDLELFKYLEYTIEVFHSPGHSPGSLVFKFKDKLFTGDVLFRNYVGRTTFFHSNYSKLCLSLKRLINIFSKFDLKLYPGHGEETTLNFELKHNKFLIEALEN